jgi:hypothetical protein
MLVFSSQNAPGEVKGSSSPVRLAHVHQHVFEGVSLAPGQTYPFALNVKPPVKIFGTMTAVVP